MSGEKPDTRERMDHMVRAMVETGADRDYAIGVARKCALQGDGDLPGGKRDNPRTSSDEPQEVRRPRRNAAGKRTMIRGWRPE